MHHYSPNSKHKLLLTENEIKKIKANDSAHITIPHSRLSKHGGFLPFLIPILAGLASAAGIAGGIATTVRNAKEAQAADKTKELVQKKIDGSGFKKIKI
jgi:hypothetical protein